MGVDVHLRDSSGSPLGQVADPDSVFESLLGRFPGRTEILAMLESRAQVGINESNVLALLLELRSLVDIAAGDDEMRQLREIVNLAMRCRQEPNTRLILHRA